MQSPHFLFGDRVEMEDVDPGIKRQILGHNDDLLLVKAVFETCLLYTSPSPRDLSTSRMPSSA